MATLLAVAGLSARMLAEAARASGFRVLALDLFGDVDTRRAAEAWWPAGEPHRLAIDDEALLTALRRLRARGDVEGWIAGSGFDGRPDLLEEGAQILPLIGNTPDVVHEVRTPARFFEVLDSLGIAHPESRTEAPTLPAGWLCKDAGSSGGWSVRRAAVGALPGGRRYYQRIAQGESMSALFLAAGGQGRVLGVSRQLIRPLGGRPFVFTGCAGPVELSPGTRAELERAVGTMSGALRLRGLNGLDFLLDGERLLVLELNPRPPASIALYGDALSGGLLRAHVAAARDARLPCRADAAAPGTRRGFETVFARRDCRIEARHARALASLGWCHDLPSGSLSAAWGEPICTISAEAGSLDEVQALLVQRRREVRFLLEQEHE